MSSESLQSDVVTASPPAGTPHPANSPPTTFAALGLSRDLLSALDAAGYETPTPIQAALIPLAVKGLDVLGQARTGTGKTAAFSLPILESLPPKATSSLPKALVLVPTRELAVQVRDEATKLGKGKRVRLIAVYGGKPLAQQTEYLRQGADIVVGTPGRVLDLMGRGSLKLHELMWVVLDEADRMLDIGFRPDIEKILKQCPASRQTLLLSATVPAEVERLSKRYMRDPETINLSVGDIAAETIEQRYFSVDNRRKYELLLRLLKREQPRQAIIFCRTKIGTQKVYQKLSERIKSVGCIHGDLPQNKRDRVMSQFRGQQLRLLVATDVVGRGIDVSGISHIINYDVPHFCDDYVHRVGRTGRMGREGIAFTFVTPEEGNELTRIELRINRLLQRDHLPGFSGVAHEAPHVPAATVTSPPPPPRAVPKSGAEPAVTPLAAAESENAEGAANEPEGGEKKKPGKKYRRAL